MSNKNIQCVKQQTASPGQFLPGESVSPAQVAKHGGQESRMCSLGFGFGWKLLEEEKGVEMAQPMFELLVCSSASIKPKDDSRG